MDTGIMNEELTDRMKNLLLQSKVYNRLRKFPDAIDKGMRCLEIAQTLGQVQFQFEMEASLELWLACTSLHHDHDAGMYREKCIAFVMQIAEEYSVDEAKLMISDEDDDRQFEAKVHYAIMGNAINNSNQLRQALWHGKKCVAIAKEIGDELIEIKACVLLAEIYYSLLEYREAILFCEKYLENTTQSTRDTQGQMKVYLILEKAYASLHDYNLSIQFGNMCISIAMNNGVKDVEMKACMTLGDACLSLNQYDDAIVHGKRCLEIAKETGDKYHEMKACFVLESAYYYLKRYDDVLLYGSSCNDIAHSLPDKVTELKACVLLLKVYYSEDPPCVDEFILYSKKLTDIAKQIGGNEIQTYADFIMEISNCLKFSIVCQYEKAVSHNIKACELAETIDDRLFLTEAYLSMARLHFLMNNTEDGQTFLGKAGEVANEIVDKEKQTAAQRRVDEIFALATEDFDSEAFPRICSFDQLRDECIYNYQQYLYSAAVDIPKFRGEYCDQTAYKLCEFIDSSEECLNQLLSDLLLFLVNQTNFDLEKMKFKKLLKMVETFNALVKALSKNESGDVITAEYEDLVMKPIQAAIAELDGLDHLHKLNMIETDKDLGTMMWCALGTMFDVVSDNSNAEELLRKSVMDFESFFDTLHVDKNQISVVEGYTTAYKNLSRVLMESDDKEEALLILDRCRAKALTYQLLSKHKIRKDVIGEEAEISMEKIASLVNTNNYAILFYALHYNCLWIFVVQSTEGDNGENCASLDFHCLNIDAEFIDALGGHEDAIPSSFKSRAMVDEDDQDTSRHQDYCCGAMRAGPPSENDDNSCYDGTASNNASSDMNRRLEKLYDGLLSPFLSKITAPEIVIIPEGPLYSLPFAALQHPTTQRYLSQDKRLRFSPSLTNLTLHLRVPEDYHSHSGSLIIGDPTNDEIPDLIDLPGSRKEAVRIAELIGGVQPLIGRQATKSAVLERLPEVCIIHLACHISLFKSVIILASKKERAPEDEEYNYLLKPEEVMKTKVRARLVVLSGCNSGRGEVSAEGVVGIARAFLAAGASAVLVSRWKVDDNTTCEFMETFYTYLLDWDQRRSASESLHLTINDMRKKYPHDPMKWSGFFLMGDDVTIDRERLSVLRDSQPTSRS